MYAALRLVAGAAFFGVNVKTYTKWPPILERLFAEPKTIAQALEQLANEGEFPEYDTLYQQVYCYEKKGVLEHIGYSKPTTTKGRAPKLYRWKRGVITVKSTSFSSTQKMFEHAFSQPVTVKQALEKLTYEGELLEYNTFRRQVYSYEKKGALETVGHVKGGNHRNPPKILVWRQHE